ncbi:glycosyltransferase family 1 protein [Atopococcus tabaci]|uniref:glycosyltransferase family 1 protein n=1 Tax=Atopococcus tabaci TaxID=269774 RepID=UPI001969CD61|nr:glycosyltransferase family 1 protein [Atopococcus tabaci]
MENKPIRILHVLGYFNYGGAEALVMNLFRHIDRSEIMFDFVVHSEEKGAFEKEAESMGARIFRVPQYTGKNHFKYRDAWKTLFKEHPEYAIIHGHVRSTASIYLKIAKEYGLRTISHSHSISSGSGLSAAVKNLMQKRIRHTADYFLACSHTAGEWLFGDQVVTQPNFHIMNNAIDAKQFIFDPEKREHVRQSLNLTDEFVVGHVGRLHESKNHFRLLDIFNQLQREHPDSRLVLVGDGELEESIEQRVAELGLTNKVIMLGARSDTYDLLQAMDVFLFPSLYEGLGISVVEAQASGLPCVVSTTVPDEAVITDLVTSVSLNEENAVWVEAIRTTSRDNRQETVSLKDIEDSGYDIKKVSQWYAEFINSILKK